MDFAKEVLEAAVGIKTAVLGGGTVGSIISLRFLGDASVVSKVTWLVGGVATSNYATPLVIELASVKAPIEGGIAFLLGVFGMATLAEINNLYKSGAIRAWIEKRLGKEG